MVYIVKGKAQGINGTYNNNYAMVFKMLDGQILDFQEYHSDLLAETRLHKKLSWTSGRKRHKVFGR